MQAEIVVRFLVELPEGFTRADISGLCTAFPTKTLNLECPSGEAEILSHETIETMRASD